jgi:hypothetical protein
LAIVNASTDAPVARKSFPSEALGALKCIIVGSCDCTAEMPPVCGFSPNSWFAVHPADHTRPPATIGGPIAPAVTFHPLRGENVRAPLSSASARIPSAQPT